jgi:hypothetical protein
MESPGASMDTQVPRLLPVHTASLMEVAATVKALGAEPAVIGWASAGGRGGRVNNQAVNLQ